MSQQFLIDKPTEGTVDIAADARHLKPLLAIPDALVDEMILSVDEDGLTTSAVDPANVAMFSLTVPASGFDAYDLDGEAFEVGLSVGHLKNRLSHARISASNPDDVSLTIDGENCYLEIEREYDSATVHRTDQFLSIDPDAIRERPDLPDLDLAAQATIGTKALTDVVEHVDSFTDHIRFSAESDDLFASGRETEQRDGEKETVEASDARFDGVLLEHVDERVTSLYSLDYVSDVISGLKDAKVAEVEVFLGDEFPIELRFERERDGEVLYSGYVMVAPRIGDPA